MTHHREKTLEPRALFGRKWLRRRIADEDALHWPKANALSAGVDSGGPDAKLRLISTRSIKEIFEARNDTPVEYRLLTLVNAIRHHRDKTPLE